MDVAVVEAGLGGRLDATNVLTAEVDVLTNVALDHTRLLGSTVREIAGEKLAVVDAGATLVVGSGLDPDAEALAHDTAERLGATLVHAPADAGVPLLAQGAFQRRNFATARAAAEALIGPLDEAAVRDAAAATLVPGRFQVVAEHPTVLLDGAHNADGIAALAASLPEWLAGRRLVAVVSVLDDKDAADDARLAAAALRRRRGHLQREPARGARRRRWSSLAGRTTHVEGDPRRAVALAKELAGEDGVVLATGSIYLIADLLRPPGRRGATVEDSVFDCEEQAPRGLREVAACVVTARPIWRSSRSPRSRWRSSCSSSSRSATCSGGCSSSRRAGSCGRLDPAPSARGSSPGRAGGAHRR